MLLDIVILPPRALGERLGKKVKEAVRGIPSIFAVDNKVLFLHLSLFHIKISKQRLGLLSDKIKEIMQNYKPFGIRSLGSYVFKKGNWVSFELAKSKTFMRLHKNIVLGSYRLRTGTMPFTSKRKMTKLERVYRKKYGTQHIFRLKKPHFTVAKFRSFEDARKAARKLEPGKFSFSADVVAIAEVNFWHQVIKILKTFKLKK